MTETEKSYDTSATKERELADKIVAIVDWLAVVNNEDHSDRESIKVGYYDAPQLGPIKHGGIYFGVHRVYYGETDKGWNEYHQVSVLHPESYRYGDNEYLFSIVCDKGRVHVGDSNDFEYNQEIVNHFIDWLASTELTLTSRKDAPSF